MGDLRYPKGYEAGGGGAGGFWLHKDWPEGVAQGGNTIVYKGWLPVQATLLAVHVYMDTVNTVGSYDLSVDNVDTGNTMLSSDPFDMTSLTDGVIGSVALTATGTDLVVPAGADGGFTITLISDNALFDGSGIYISLYFE